MGLTKFPNGVSSFGIPVLGSGDLTTTGSVFFVDSGAGSDGNTGTDKDHPFATLDYAIGKCADTNGDIIILMPGHAETTTAIALDVAGVTIVGIGHGRARPTLTATTAASDLIDVTVANCRIENIRLVGAASGCTSLISIGSAAHDFECVGCSLEHGAAPLIAVIVTTGADRFSFRDCLFLGTAAGPDAAIDVQGSGDSFDWSVINCTFNYDGSAGLDEAAIRDDNTSTGLLISNCRFIGMDATAIDFNSSATGIIEHCSVDSNNATSVAEMFDIGTMSCVENYIAQVSKSGAKIPATTATP